MKFDLYTKLILTLIALCLLNMNFGQPIRVSHANASSAQAGWIIDTILGCIDGGKINDGIIKLKCTSY